MLNLQRKCNLIFYWLFFSLLLSSPATYSYVSGSVAYCLIDSVQQKYPDYFPQRGNTSQEVSWSGDTGYIRISNDQNYDGKLLVYRDAVYYSFYAQDWVYFSDFKTADDYFNAGYCNRVFGNTAISKPNAPTGVFVSTPFSNRVQFDWSGESNNNNTAIGYYLYEYINGVWTQIGTTYNRRYVQMYHNGITTVPSTHYYAITAYNSVGFSNFVYATITIPEWSSKTIYIGKVSTTNPVNSLTTTTGSSGTSATNTTGNSTTSTTNNSNSSTYNVVSPRIDNSSQVGLYSGTQKNDVYQIESGDFSNQLDIVVGGNDIIQFPGKLNVQQNIMLYGVSMNAYNRNPADVSGVRRNGNDLYFQYNGSLGSGSVTIQNYFTGSNASKIQLIPMFGGTNYSAMPWIPVL